MNSGSISVKSIQKAEQSVAEPNVINEWNKTWVRKEREYQSQVVWLTS